MILHTQHSPTYCLYFLYATYIRNKGPATCWPHAKTLDRLVITLKSIAYMIFKHVYIFYMRILPTYL